MTRTEPAALRGRARWQWLRSAARRVRRHPRRRADQVAALGSLLLEVKAVVGHGAFRAWLAEHCPHSYRVAAEAMRAARLFGGQKCTARNFGPSALRVLTNGRMPKARQERLLRTPPADKPIGALGAILRTLEPDERPREPEDYAVDVSDEERAYLQLAELAQKCTMVHISIDRDDPDLPLVTVHAYYDGGAIAQSWTRGTLAGALAAATDQEPRRRCPKCKLVKPGSAFARSTTYCRPCERERVKSYG